MSEIGKYNNPKQVIEQWLINPRSMDAEGMVLLNQWLIEFPWFGSLHSLKAVYAKEQGLSDYPHHLHRAAITSHDRGMLYEMVNTPISTNFVSKSASTPETKTTSLQELDTNITLTDWVDIFLEEEFPNKTVVQHSQPQWENWSISVHAPESIKEDGLLLQPIGEQVLPEGVDSSEKEIETQINEYPESVDFSELGELGQDILNKAISSSIELEVSEKEIAPEEAKSHAPSVETADYGDSFLNFIAAALGQPIEESEPQHQQIYVTPEDRKKEDVIERFIQTEPQINRGKAIEYVAGNMAKESLEEDLNLVTETMAKLYIKQGKLDKARKAYKKLIELYPEKSIYFATQLKNLNKKN